MIGNTFNVNIHPIQKVLEYPSRPGSMKLGQKQRAGSSCRTSWNSAANGFAVVKNGSAIVVFPVNIAQIRETCHIPRKKYVGRVDKVLETKRQRKPCLTVDKFLLVIREMLSSTQRKMPSFSFATIANAALWVV